MSVIDRTTETRFERRKRQTREQIKQATGALMLEHGYASLSVRGITERADVGYGTFYLHYHDLDDAVWDVALEIMTTENLRMTEAMLALPHDVRAYHGWRWLFSYVAEHRAEYLELFGTQGSAELRKRYQSYLTGIYEEGMRTQTYSPPINLPVEFLTQFMAGATVQLILWWLETPTPHTPDDMAAMLYRMVYRSESPRP
jgi:AcrR family transcriptional regulator